MFQVIKHFFVNRLLTKVKNYPSLVPPEADPETRIQVQLFKNLDSHESFPSCITGTGSRSLACKMCEVGLCPS